jgi:hypothetical protein
MDIPSQTVITVLIYLLPGFITASLVYALTPAPKLIPFERVVQALIFTILVQVGVSGVGFVLRKVGAAGLSIGPWTENVRLAWSVVLAGALGLLLTWAANTDRIHGLLRKAKITCETSYPSPWFGAFSQNKGYVVLHLVGKRRLLGWAVEWPSTPGKGHFVMTQPEWLPDTAEGASIELPNVNQLLIRAEDVEMVELMKISNTQREEPNGRTTSTDASSTAAGTEGHQQGSDVSSTAPVSSKPAAATSTEEVGLPNTKSRTFTVILKETPDGRS